jgi:hypothetical protein
LAHILQQVNRGNVNPRMAQMNNKSPNIQQGGPNPPIMNNPAMPMSMASNNVTNNNAVNSMQGKRTTFYFS